MSQEIMKLQNGSDVRGIALEGVADEHVNLTGEACNKIGQAFVKWLSKKTGKSADNLKIGVGRDSRISGPALEEAVVKGMLSEGATVVRCGLATTPSMFMSIVFKQTKFDGSVEITASHLPFNRNGLKFFDKDGGLEHDDITEILEIASGLSERDADLDTCISFDLISLYAEHLKNAISNQIEKATGSKNDKPLLGLKIVVDSGNGASGFFVDKILRPLGADTTGSQF